MDCKHEIEIYIEDGDEIEELISYFCNQCAERYSQNEVVILTKSQHDLTQDVVEAASEYLNVYEPNLPDNPVRRAREKMAKTLDALKGE